LKVEESTVRSEISKILRSSVQATLTQNGYTPPDLKISQIFENLTLLLLAYPASVFDLLQIHLQEQRGRLEAILTSLRRFYTSDALGGLPARTSPQNLETEALREILPQMRIFASAFFGGEVVPSRAQEITEVLDDLSIPAARNLRGLSEPQARSSLTRSLGNLERAMIALDLSKIPTFVEAFETFALKGSTLASLATRIHLRLSELHLRLRDQTAAQQVISSPEALTVFQAAVHFLTLLRSAPSLLGTSIWGPGLVDFPDDDLVLEGVGGRTAFDLVVLGSSTLGQPLRFQSGASLPGRVTTDRLVVVEGTLAVGASASVYEPILASGVGYGVGSIRAGGVGRAYNPLDLPPGPNLSDHLQDLSASFLASGVSGGDILHAEKEGGGSVVVTLVEGLGVDDPTSLLRVDQDFFDIGDPIEPYAYVVYASTSSLFEDPLASFDDTLLGARIELEGIGTALISRVLSETKIEVSGASFVMDPGNLPDSPPIGAAVAYTLYQSFDPAGSVLQWEGSPHLFDFLLPPGTPVRLRDDVTGRTFSDQVVAVLGDHRLLVGSTLDATHTYSLILFWGPQEGDRIFLRGSFYEILEFLSPSEIRISPEIPAGEVLDGQIIDPQISLTTPLFWDAGRDFIQEGVQEGHLLVTAISGRRVTSVVLAVGKTHLRVDPPLPVEEMGISYRVLRREDESTAWVEPSAPFSDVQEGDALAVPGQLVRSVIGVGEHHLESSPDLPLGPSVTALIVRGGTPGYAHYELLRQRLLALELGTLETFRRLLGAVLESLGSLGALRLTFSGRLLRASEGSNTTEILYGEGPLEDLRFGDALWFSGGGEETAYVQYVREVLPDLQQVVFFPPLTSPSFSESLETISVYRSSTSEALFELRALEEGLESLQEILNGYRVQEVSELRVLVDYLSRQGYDRARDLLVSGDLSTLARASVRELSYAGRLQGVLNEAASLLGPEGDLVLGDLESVFGA
jgi:hypothetical protein